MIEYGHNVFLVFLSLLVALVAGFTGLSLTKDLSSKSFSQSKIAVALASSALGRGIWSMNFVAMLGTNARVFVHPRFCCAVQCFIKYLEAEFKYLSNVIQRHEQNELWRPSKIRG
jgi:NO-binding membrane sensor protein with MHYT domain